MGVVGDPDFCETFQIRRNARTRFQGSSPLMLDVKLVVVPEIVLSTSSLSLSHISTVLPRTSYATRDLGG